jgi:hypothetical protein
MTTSPPFSVLSDPLFLRKVAERIEAQMRRRRSTNRLKDYRPYPKQREFHAAGKFAHERLFMAGNQLGKTLAGGRRMGDAPVRLRRGLCHLAA